MRNGIPTKMVEISTGGAIPAQPVEALRPCAARVREGGPKETLSRSIFLDPPRDPTGPGRWANSTPPLPFALRSPLTAISTSRLTAPTLLASVVDVASGRAHAFLAVLGKLRSSFVSSSDLQGLALLALVFVC